MSLELHLGPAPRLLAGEQVLYFKPVIWMVSGKSLPSYRIAPWLPLIQEMAFYVTNRRVLLPCWLMLRLVRFEWAAWLRREDSVPDQDVVQTAGTGRHPLLGPYLQLITVNPVPHWYRSRQARIRFYMKAPEIPCRLISDLLGSR